ncbi:GspE/PulE family protein [Burkholderia sp. MBR-1]|uniref:GspE/PulE family protein n=1 Tax=Burkholderia sp. MBR-1 TaxID=2732364 RepID=UPI0015EE63CE|nr:ATPase, T2SS/T4P/T4SS family [Burkholderia sp. MBR-1]QMI49765.1 Flp pilus assembly complex ATPase component TadA [Burkholderia sp. MBR-1]
MDTLSFGLLVSDPTNAPDPRTLRSARQFTHTDRGDEEVVAFLNHVFVEAADLGASDVHFRDDPAYTTVRYRVGENLVDKYYVERSASLTIDLKIRARAQLPATDRDTPLDGKFWFDLGDRFLEARVNVTPQSNGQTIVCRLLDQANAARRIDEIEMSQEVRVALAKALRFKEGVILVVGPTGSGKTSTLYACLNELNTPDIHIATVEDPVEYALPRASQINVNPSRTFTMALRALLRQDIDVGLVGEIRDAETAETALKAGMTGHLMLSTLHASTSVIGISRMLDFGLEPYSVGASMIAIIAQRLEARMCPHCCQEYRLNDDDLEHLARSRYDRKGPFFVPNPDGCPKCRPGGEKGRVPIIEMLVRSTEVKRAIIARDLDEVSRLAREQPQYRALPHAAFDLSSRRLLSFRRAMQVTAE